MQIAEINRSFYSWMKIKEQRCKEFFYGKKIKKAAQLDFIIFLSNTKQQSEKDGIW